LQPAVLGNLEGLESYLSDKTKKWFETVRDLNGRYPDGYVLAVPAVSDFAVILAGISSFGQYLSFESMVTNARAIVTWEESEGATAHAITLARERRIAYAGFPNSCKLGSQLRTGDVVSVVIRGVNAQLVKVAGRPRVKLGRIMGEYKVVKRNTDDGRDELVFNKTPDYDDIYNAIGDFLNEVTEDTWSFVEDDISIGGKFTNTADQVIHVDGTRSLSEFTLRFGPRRGDDKAKEVALDQAKIKELIQKMPFDPQV
jgi:hypothetical protein